MTFSIKASQLSKILLSSLHELESGAYVDTENLLLCLKYRNLIDIGTYPLASQVSGQYIQMADGDAVLLNDPYSGGDLLSTKTLVMAIDLPPASKKGEPLRIYLCTRIAFKPMVQVGKSIGPEELRIPPSPIFSDGEFNDAFFEAVEGHPQCPLFFKDEIKKTIGKMQRARNNLSRQLQFCGISLNKKSLAQYHKQAYEQALCAIADISIGESLIEKDVGPDETLALRIESGDSGILFDFTNTTPSISMCLTDSATSGACIGALISILKSNFPINSGIIQAVDVVTPQGSMVNAKFPSPVFLGLTDGVSLIAATCVKLFGDIDSSRKFADPGISQCSLQIDFEGYSDHYYDFLGNGTPASPSQPGVSGFELWKRTQLHPSIEMAEEKFPIKVISHGYRQNSGGSGGYSGGEGVTRVIEVLKKGSMTWTISLSRSKPEGYQGGKAASGAELFVVPPGGKKEKLPPQGTRELAADSLLIIHSEGGGGFGEPTPEDDE